jgi:hypothetical protein
VTRRISSDLLTLTFRVQGALYGAVDRQARAVLRFWNVPVHSDVERLQGQVGALASEIHKLRATLEEPSSAPKPARRRKAAAAKRPST